MATYNTSKKIQLKVIVEDDINVSCAQRNAECGSLKRKQERFFFFK